jgi:hypothetical protein
MVNEYNNGNTLCIVPVGGTKPTHGDYILGAILLDENPPPNGGLFKLGNTSPPLTWYRLVNKWNVPKNITLDYKYGVYMSNGMAVIGDGMMQDVQGVGSTVTFNGIDGSGTSHSFSTGSSVAQNAGIQIIRPVGSFAGLTRLNFVPTYAFRGTPTTRSGADSRLYSGWVTNTTGVAVSDSPLAQADGGIVVGYGSGDTNFNVWHGDGTNPISKTELTGATVPASTTNLLIDMIAITQSNILVVVSNGNTLAVLGSANITTNLPVNTKTLNWQTVVQNATTTPSKNLAVYGAYMEALR